ncbi:hypothetical protein L9F63_013006, partial [Diploptera punctata]
AVGLEFRVNNDNNETSFPAANIADGLTSFSENAREDERIKKLIRFSLNCGGHLQWRALEAVVSLSPESFITMITG